MRQCILTFLASDLTADKEDIWQAGNVKIADTPLRRTHRLNSARPVRKNVNFWIIPATRRIVPAMAWTNVSVKNNFRLGVGYAKSTYRVCNSHRRN
jgi:hypothetical protein